MIKTLIPALCCALFAISSVHADGGLTLRPIDKATVRVIGVGGAHATAFESKRSKWNRVIAVPKAGHGTGVLISRDGLILTARHVIEGTDILAVMLPGNDEAVAAKIVYVDTDRDLAVLQAEGDFPNYIKVPTTQSSVSLGDRISTSGYPLDVSQKFPAATSGDVSRLTNSGYLQLSMSVNPGNSGGPVVTKSGELLGILIARGDPSSGVEGVAIVEPMKYVLRAVNRAKDQVKGSPTMFEPTDVLRAHIVTRFVSAEDDGRPVYEKTSATSLSKVAAAKSSAEEALVVAAYSWNMHVALLEDYEVGEIAQLPEPHREHARALREIATRSARDAMAKAPYAVNLYPIGRSIVNLEKRVSSVPSTAGGATTNISTAHSQGAAQAHGGVVGGVAQPPSPTSLSVSMGTAIVTPYGDFGDGAIGTSYAANLRLGFGNLGLRALGAIWSEEFSTGLTNGFLHLGADYRIESRPATMRLWASFGGGVDMSILDSEAPVDGGKVGLGVNLDIGIQYKFSDTTALDLSVTLHPGFTDFAEDENIDEVPDVAFYGLGVGLTFL
tara:strand:+ start:75322 stop:76986 length:1665 start_codon:yes stop_codon:yes gene_type:complete